ncbi:MAG: zf-HC2 domain-containing protein [Bacteroidales bacterium]|nr:zf-HC2 domain-containing protein [Bacteroidales bacterium]
MNKKNIHSIFETGTCLSIEQMQHYLDGKLSAKEVYSFEKHINACPACNDVFEGLQHMKNPSKIEAITDELNSKIDKYLIFSKKQENKQANKLWKIAASILLLIASGFFINYYSQKMIQNFAIEEKMVQEPQAQEFQAIKNQPELNEEITEQETTPEKEFTQAKNGTYTQKKENKNTIVKSELNNNDDALATVNEFDDLESSEEPNEEIMSVNKKEELAKDNFENEINVIGYDTNANISRAKIASSGLSKKKSISYLQQGTRAYHEKNYSLALENLKIAEKQNENPEQTNYYLALTYYSIKDYKKSKKYLEKLSNSTDNIYYWDALWYQSQILIKQNRIDKAKELLKQISKSKSIYKNQAQTQLDSLNY